MTAGLPDEREQEEEVSRVLGDVMIAPERADLLGRLVVLVPGGRGLVDAGLLERGGVVEHGRRPVVGRQRVDLAVDGHVVPGGLYVVLLEVPDAEFGEVGELAGNGEVGDDEVLEHGQVRDPGTGLNGVVERLVLVRRGARVDDLDLDVRVRGLEAGDGLLDRAVPAPDRELHLFGTAACGAAGGAGAA